ncbi:hypothetical protein QJS04_geneDACA002566 [Acorus gramineus]|uniref:Endonuclease/exonuclease/phosphatase domain-containing protein n=1 Tax=Acorus gramineus TaxID=55184 RepID=A0AAV9APJ7_ACOGR|nr:hypothetical protein QJS04_geneDACA002566 [Acorus gramineus]
MIDMCIWNVRGLNNRVKQLEVKRFLDQRQPTIFALLETKVNSLNMELVKCSLRRDFSLLTNNSPTSAGRIWVLWDPEVVHIRPVISNDQFLHCEVTSNVQPMKWLISVVYASNSATQRALLWTDLADLSTLCQSSPWIVSGDFNEVRYGSEKMGGRPIHSRRAFKFNRMISHAGLQDVKATGHHLSWNNNQEERVAYRLDRTLVNSIWLSKYPEGFVHYHPRGHQIMQPWKFSITPLCLGFLPPSNSFKCGLAILLFKIQFVKLGISQSMVLACSA